MEKKIVLNQKQLFNFIKESVTRVMTEGTTDNEIENKWMYLKKSLGPDRFLDALYSSMSDDEIKGLVEYIYTMFDDKDENEMEQY